MRCRTPRRAPHGLITGPDGAEFLRRHTVQPRRLRCAASLPPAFVHVDVMRHRLNVVAISETALCFAFGKDGADAIVPAQFAGEGIPDKFVSVIERATVFLAPLEDIFVTAAREDARFQVVVIHMKESKAPAV